MINDLQFWGTEIATPEYVCSKLYKVGNTAVIVKPPMSTHDHSFLRDPQLFDNPETEIDRRRSAYNISREIPPDLCPEQTFEIGEVDDVKVVIKNLDWLDNVLPLAEIPSIEILQDEKICDALERTFAFALSQFVFKGRKFDLISDSYNIELNNPIIRKIIGTIMNKNIFVGYNDRRERVIFIDSDWYFTREERLPSFKKDIFPTVLFAADFLALFLINRAKEYIKNTERGSGVLLK